MLSNNYRDIRIDGKVYASGFVKEARWNKLSILTDFKECPPHWVMVF